MVVTCGIIILQCIAASFVLKEIFQMLRPKLLKGILTHNIGKYYCLYVSLGGGTIFCGTFSMQKRSFLFASFHFG